MAIDLCGKVKKIQIFSVKLTNGKIWTIITQLFKSTPLLKKVDISIAIYDSLKINNKHAVAWLQVFFKIFLLFSN